MALGTRWCRFLVVVLGLVLTVGQVSYAGVLGGNPEYTVGYEATTDYAPVGWNWHDAVGFGSVAVTWAAVGFGSAHAHSVAIPYLIFMGYGAWRTSKYRSVSAKLQVHESLAQQEAAPKVGTAAWVLQGA